MIKGELTMEIPKNCTECPDATGCRSYYGGSLCKYGKEINRAAIAAQLNKPKGGERNG